MFALFARLRWCVQESLPLAKCGDAVTVNCSHALVTAKLLLTSGVYMALKLLLPTAGICDAELGTLSAWPTGTVETTVPVPGLHTPFGYSV